MKILIFIALVFCSLLVTGQHHTAASRSELGFLIGGSYYQGDLNPLMPFRNTHLAGGLIYRYNVHSRLSVRANLTYGKVSGDDANSKEAAIVQRNLNFSSEIYELGLGIEFNYFPFQLGHDRYKGTAYIMAELGLFRMNPKTNYNGAEIELQPLGTEGQGTSLSTKNYYGLTQLCVPLGIGAKLSIGKRIGVNFEIGIRKTFTDYLDDVGSDSYADPEILAAENGPLAADLSNKSGSLYGKRGNNATKDWYVFSGMMVTISLGNPDNCSFRQ